MKPKQIATIVTTGIAVAGVVLVGIFVDPGFREVAIGVITAVAGVGVPRLGER